MFTPHYQFVSALRWVGGGNDCKLLSCSYDGSLRLLDASAGLFSAFDGIFDEEAEFSAMDATLDGNTVFLASPDGELCVFDARAGKIAQVRRRIEGAVLSVALLDRCSTSLPHQ